MRFFASSVEGTAERAAWRKEEGYAAGAKAVVILATGFNS
jgi:hypothetical protein